MKGLKWRTLGALALGAGLCAMGAVATGFTTQAEGTDTNVTATIENDKGFYMTKGAQVRLPSATAKEGYDETGIRFAVNLQSAYLEQLENTYETVTFYSLIAVNGASATVPNGFTGEDSTTVIDNVALLEWRENDYGTLKDGVYTYYITPTNMQKGYDIELTVGAVAKVTDAQGEVEYLYAKPNDNTRTMEAVALTAYLDNKTNSKYAYLNKYYGTATEYKGSHVQEYGDSTVSFTSDITVAELSENAYACIGATKVALTDGTVAIDSAETYLTAGETYPVSIFDGDKAYTKEMLYITREVNQASDLSIFALTDHDVEGYYLVTADIDASAETTITHTDATVKDDAYDFDYKFTGTFDGNGHTIKANVSYGGVFGVLANATITNAKFILTVGGYNSSMDNSGLRPTGLAQTALNTTISNVYAELNAGANLKSNRSYAISLIMKAPKLNDGYLKTQNVVVMNNDNFDNITVDAWYTAGALFYEDAGRVYADRDEYMTNVFVIAPKTFGVDNSGYVAMASGTKQSTFASNDTDSKEAVDELLTDNDTFYQFANATRYSTVKDFVESLAWENKIPNFIMENLLVNGTTISVGKTDLQDKGEIALPLNEEQEVTLQIGEKALTAVELSCVEGEEFVEIDGDAFTLTEVGTATLTATGKFGEMSVVVTFTVTLETTTYEEVVLFSGTDGDVDMKAIFGEGATLASAYGTDGTVYEVADNKIKGLTNETNAPIEKTLLLASENNEWKYVTFKVYTKLIDQAGDLTVFNLTDKDITGCYLVTDTIDASGIEATVHTDFANAETGGGANRGYGYKFTGTFDGNGHTVKANVTYGGLFGVLNGATITNTHFVLYIGGNNSTANNTGNRPTGLAQTALNSTISNVYAELNIGTGLASASTRDWAISLIQTTVARASGYLKLQNIVVVNNDDFANLKVYTSWYTVGALFFTDGGRASGERADDMKNVFVIAPQTFGGDNANNTATGYVVMASGTAQSTFAKNDTDSKTAVQTLLPSASLWTLNATRYSELGDLVTYVESEEFKEATEVENGIPSFMLTKIKADSSATSAS